MWFVNLLLAIGALIVVALISFGISIGGVFALNLVMALFGSDISWGTCKVLILIGTIGITLWIVLSNGWEVINGTDSSSGSSSSGSSNSRTNLGSSDTYKSMESYMTSYYKNNFGFYDTKGYYRRWGESFYDYEGVLRNWDHFVDSRGYWASGDNFVDAHGNYTSLQRGFYDCKDNWVNGY